MVVFFDIDGTIVDEETQAIPQSTIRAVEALKKNGHIAVVNTSRPFAHIDPRVRALDFSGWVCSCGMELWMNGECIKTNFPSLALCCHVRDSVRLCNMDVLYETVDGAILTDHPHSSHPVAVLEVQRMRQKGFTICQIDDRPAPSFVKGMAYGAPNCDREEFLRRMEPYFTCIDRGNTLIEFVLKGCSKAGGMKDLLQILGENREITLAIGDSTNDLPMFAHAGHTVCLGGSMEELKAVAEYVTAPVMEDGIEKALRHFGLI